MGFFSKLIDAIRGGNKEELEKLKDEALDKVNDVAKDLGEKIDDAKDAINEKYGDDIKAAKEKFNEVTDVIGDKIDDAKEAMPRRNSTR